MSIWLYVLVFGLVSAPIIGIGGAWYFELMPWSPFWNTRFNRPYYRGMIYKGQKFVGYFIKTVKNVAGNPIIFDSEKWGAFARPTDPTQEWLHGNLETRIIYRQDLVDAGRSMDGIHQPEKLVFGDDPKTIRRMVHSEQIKDLTARPKDTDWTKVFMMVAAVIALLVTVYFLTGGGH